MILLIIFGNFLVFVIIFRRWKLLNLNTWLIGQLAYSYLLFPHPLSWKYFLFRTVCLTFLTSSLFRMLWGPVFFLLRWQWRDTIWFLNLLCTWKKWASLWCGKLLSQHGYKSVLGIGTSIIDSKMFRVRYVCNNVTVTTEDSPPTDIETVHIAYAFFFY